MNLVALRPRSDHEEKLVRAKWSMRPALDRVPHLNLTKLKNLGFELFCDLT